MMSDEIDDIADVDQVLCLEHVIRAFSSPANLQGVEFATMPVTSTAERAEFDKD